MSVPGLVVLDKPGGLTSHDVVARVRRILGTRKVGHAGTLDPMATGVLVLGIDRATRLLGHLALRDKSYRATVRLGASTVTDDADGEIISTSPPGLLDRIEDASILHALAAFAGAIDQRPSSVSAVKVAGRRAHQRVRAGEEVELAPRRVTITRIEATRIVRTPDHVDVDVEIDCSTGTYVRAIARDLGGILGVGGHLTALRRTRVGPFEEMIDLAELERRGADAVLPLNEVALTCFPVWRVDATHARAVAHGQRIAWPDPAPPSSPVAVVGPDGSFLALAVDDGGTARYPAVLA